MKGWLARAVSAGRGRGVPVVTLHTLDAQDRAAPSVDEFEALLLFMKERYDLMPVGELPQACRDRGGRLPASITFDDGFEDCRTLALPILLRHGVRASFFVCPDFAEGRTDITRGFADYRGRQPMDVGAIRDLAAAGMEIGAHTLTHPLLSALSPAEQEREIIGSKTRIEEWLGRDVTSFAIPFGGRRTFNATTRAIVSAHFQVCCTTMVGTNPVAAVASTGCTFLRRLDMTADDSRADMASKLLGDWDIYFRFPRAAPQPLDES